MDSHYTISIYIEITIEIILPLKELKSGTLPSDMKILVKTSNARTITLEVDWNELVDHVNSKILDKEDILPDQQQLIFDDERLENVRTLSKYNIQS